MSDRGYGEITRQVRCAKTSESESPMTYRNECNDVETRGLYHLWDKCGKLPMSWPRGIRYIGDVSAYQALMRNMRTCRCDVKGERRVSGPHEAESTKAQHRGGATRSSGDDS